MSVWTMILLWALAKAIEWLLLRDKLSDKEQAAFNTVIHRCRRLEYEAVRCGCRPGGLPEP